jgi:hypothetical protein
MQANLFKLGGIPLSLQHISEALRDSYEDTNWMLWKFEYVPDSTWESEEFQLEYLEWYSLSTIALFIYLFNLGLRTRKNFCPMKHGIPLDNLNYPISMAKGFWNYIHPFHTCFEGYSTSIVKIFSCSLHVNFYLIYY